MGSLKWETHIVPLFLANNNFNMVICKTLLSLPLNSFSDSTDNTYFDVLSTNTSSYHLNNRKTQSWEKKYKE